MFLIREFGINQKEHPYSFVYHDTRFVGNKNTKDTECEIS